jgi:hypothetical protein
MLRDFWFHWSVRCLALALFAHVPLAAEAQMSSKEAPSAAAVDKRFALVIGQSDYRDARLITGTADASRIAEALETAGFEIESGADLEQHLIREKIRTLAEKASQSGGEETIFVYLCGRVAQINGENILLPVGSPVERASDVLLNGFRLNDLVNTLKLVPAKARVVVVDAGAPPQQLASDRNFSPGLAILEAPEGFLIVFNQNPGRPLPEPQPPMGLFALALLDAMQQPVGSFGDFFALARKRVFEDSKNHQMPWDDDKLGTSGFAFFPPKEGTALPSLVLRGGDKVQVSTMSRDQAFQAIIAADSIADYQAFLVKFPNDEAVPTIQYNLAVRREAEVWARALKMNTAEGYWTYIQSYPDGGNVEVARSRLTLLGANSAAPPAFIPVAFGDLPPPLPIGELIASSASLPVEFIPRAPGLNLPPIAPAVAAVAAIPVADAAGHQLARAQIASVRPNWAAAYRRGPPVGMPTAPGFERPGQRPQTSGSATPVPSGTYQPIGGVQSSRTPAPAGAQPSVPAQPNTGGYRSVTPQGPSAIPRVVLSTPNAPVGVPPRPAAQPNASLPVRPVPQPNASLAPRSVPQPNASLAPRPTPQPNASFPLRPAPGPRIVMPRMPAPQRGAARAASVQRHK